MKRSFLIIPIFALVLTTGCNKGSQSEVTFVGGTSRWIFSNGIVNVVVKPAQGVYEILRTRDQKKIITGAYLRIEGDSTNEPLRKVDYSLSDFFHSGETGKYLLISSSKEGKPGLGLRFGLLPGKDYLVIDGGIMNTGKSTMHVHEISVITNGKLYEGRNLKPGFRMLDGNGGGEDTRVTEKPSLDCRNNLLLTWGRSGKREVLVAGGLKYTEIEKFVKVSPARNEKKAVHSLPAGLKPVARLDAGRNSEVFAPPVKVSTVHGSSYRWDAGYGPEYDDILYDKQDVVLAISGLKPGTRYALGLAWSDDADTRTESVAWSISNGSLNTLLAPKKLPSHGGGEAPEQIWLNLPANAVTVDTLLIHFRNEGGINAVISDFSVCEGQVKENLNGVGHPVPEEIAEQENLRLNLYARDPVGKRIDPGQAWFPEDAFYISVGHSNPFEALEDYGDILKDFQKIHLAYYTFPTVCLWYAQHKGYGGGPSINDAPGAVAEMDRAVKSGFLRYSPVAIRLVPDAYEENNEQGWWDEKHWQMYGTGKFASPPDGNVDVAPGHYKKPYETTRKWAGAIIDRGGIPITYFQTGRRSDDYAAAFPEHMLFNGKDTTIPDKDWMIKGKVSYDFTDPGFLTHMKEVYNNLAAGGVQGLMYDYPYTGWAQHGGMEDAWSTTASAYRTVFQLARKGLGRGAWLDERNLDHGSDITLGIVSSQRIWGDTDKMSPFMISMGGLRWYKNRKVVSYDMDAKNLLKAQPANTDGVRKLLTLMYATCGRFLMANSFDRLGPEMVRDLSRIFPYPDSWISARPVDAFVSKYPEMFAFKIQEGWYQLVVYNPDDQKPSAKTVRFSSPDYFGALDLKAGKRYLAYEFWDNKPAGEFMGSDSLKLELRPGEAKMISIREKTDFPQLLSTDRHIMQGLIEIRDMKWQPETMQITGQVNLIEGEAMNLVFADNGYSIKSAEVDGGTANFTSPDHDRLSTVKIAAEQPGWKTVKINYQK
ncbi:MAG: hypothetical protein WCW62_02160 [Bacteroidales bacterium]